MIIDDTPTEDLASLSLQLGESKKSAGGALVTTTGACTGRSPNAKSIVKDSITESKVDWSMNNSINREEFIRTRNEMKSYLANIGEEKIYTQKLYANRDPENALKLKRPSF